MTLELPVDLQTQKDTLNSLVSLARLKTSLTRSPVTLIVTNKRGETIRADFTDPHALVRKGFVLNTRFLHGIKVRITLSKVVNGRVVVVVLRPKFKVKNTLLFIEASALQLTVEANLRFAKLRQSKIRPTVWFSSVASSPRPNPEAVTASISKFSYSQASGYHLFDVQTYYRYYREYSSVRTPNFAELKKKGQLPNNPHHVLMWHTIDGGYYVQHEDVLNPQWSSYFSESNAAQFGTSDGGPAPSISHLATSSRNTAIRRLQQRTAGDSSNLSETIATINLTTRMIGNAAIRIATALRAVRKLQFTNAANILFAAQPRRFRRDKTPASTQDLASNWLAFQYGWKPLLQDIHYSVEAIGKLALPDLSVGNTRASASEKNREVIVLKPNAAGNPPDTGYVVILTRTTRKFQLRYKLADPLQAFLSQSGFTNPVSLAWELLPFSFVVDWFLPIGPYLESLTAWGGLQFLDGCETAFTRKEYHYMKSYDGNTLPYGDVDPNNSWTIRGFREDYGILLDRNPLGDFPSQTAPSFKNPFSVTHALNGVALLHQVFKGVNPRTRYSL